MQICVLAQSISGLSPDDISTKGTAMAMDERFAVVRGIESLMIKEYCRNVPDYMGEAMILAIVFKYAERNEQSCFLITASFVF
ncbi:unnamed protein product [Strongylus vulgaris]|uniref:Uncharacterized protein n=1 Tax=Strongylus vulgaris TaxID=40348 RepID=A0A3P7JMC6_STRVU|nr:unnamed protein product [Strongylus vulgaris]